MRSGHQGAPTVGVPGVMVMGGVAGVLELDDPPRVARMAPAVTPAAIATMMITLAVVLMPGPPPGPPTLVCVMVAVAVWPPEDAVTRICISPETRLKRMPRMVAWPCASVVTVSDLVPSKNVPPGPWLGRKKTTAAPAIGF